MLMRRLNEYQVPYGRPSDRCAKRNSITGLNYYPRVATNIKLSDSTVLRASVTRAYRNPGAFENYGDLRVSSELLPPGIADMRFLAIGDIKPEQLTSYELGFLHQSSDLPLTVDVKLYKEIIKDMITTYDFDPASAGVADPVDGTAETFDNIDSVTVRGLEAQLEYRWGSYLRTFASYSHSLASGTDNDPEQYLYSESIPMDIFSFMGMFRSDAGIRYSLTYTRVDSMQWLGWGDLIEAYDRIDFHMAAPIKGNNYTGSLGFTAQNIMDDAYQEFRNDEQFNSFDQRFFVTFNLQVE